MQITLYEGLHETIDRLSLNGSSASYALLYPKQNYTRSAFGLGCTGTVIVTRNGGQTWQFVDILGNGFRYYHPNGLYPQDWQALANAAGMPKAFARSKSITNGREAWLPSLTGNWRQSNNQWYYTDDHINWYPTTNADRLTDATTNLVRRIYNTTYATDPEHTGIITEEGGTCSYWKSGAGVPPTPPEEPTFNWRRTVGSATEPPGLGNLQSVQRRKTSIRRFNGKCI